jgi:hypothetical protein
VLSGSTDLAERNFRPKFSGKCFGSAVLMVLAVFASGALLLLRLRMLVALGSDVRLSDRVGTARLGIYRGGLFFDGFFMLLM